MADHYTAAPAPDGPDSAQRGPRLLAVPAAPDTETTGGAPGVDERARELSPNEFTAVCAVAALVAALGLIGFVNSFASVQAAAQPSFGWLAFTVPLGIDLGIAIFAALDIVLARLRMRLRWLRLIPWTLTAATIYLNVAGEATLFGKVAHAVLPALWVVAVEVAAHVVRIRAELTATDRMDRVRASRWLLSPWRTAMLRRRMVLWEIRSYPEALSRERERLLSLTELQDEHGPLTWRWKAPRRTKALYRLGELTPTPDLPALPPAADHAGHTVDQTGHQTGQPAISAPPADRPARTTRGTRTAKPRTRAGSRSRSRGRPAPDVADLMPLGWQIAADLDRQGEPLTRDALASALRERGQPAGNARAGALLARLKTEPPPAPGTTANAAAPEGDPRA